MALFDFSELTEKDLTEKCLDRKESSENTSTALIEKYEGMHFRKIEGIRDLMGDYPAAGDIYFLWTQNQFNAVTFILYIIRNFSVIDELTFSSYAINERIVNSLAKWYDSGAIRRITIFISDTVKVRNAKTHDLLVMQAERRGWQIIYAWNHSKIMLMKSGENYFCIEGSGNLSDNSRFENYIFTNNRRVYEFRKECICPRLPQSPL